MYLSDNSVRCAYVEVNSAIILNSTPKKILMMISKNKSVITQHWVNYKDIDLVPTG